MMVLGLRRKVEALGRRNTIEYCFSELKGRIREFNACFQTYSTKV